MNNPVRLPTCGLFGALAGALLLGCPTSPAPVSCADVFSQLCRQACACDATCKLDYTDQSGERLIRPGDQDTCLNTLVGTVCQGADADGIDQDPTIQDFRHGCMEALNAGPVCNPVSEGGNALTWPSACQWTGP